MLDVGPRTFQDAPLRRADRNIVPAMRAQCFTAPVTARITSRGCMRRATFAPHSLNSVKLAEVSSLALPGINSP
jgi:hypothetical protein